MASIRIIVGSVMGTAVGVAESAKAILEGFGHDVTIVNNFGQSTLSSDDIILVCTSNTGMGDLPQNILPFFSYLVQKNPPIAGMKYGIITLGDSSYLNFAEAGKIIDEALADSGAIRIGDPLVLDAIYIDDPEEESAAWVTQWQTHI